MKFGSISSVGVPACRALKFWSVSSVGLEHRLDRAGVVGSNPIHSTKVGRERPESFREGHWFESIILHYLKLTAQPLDFPNQLTRFLDARL